MLPRLLLMSVIGSGGGKLPLELKIGPLHQFQWKLDTFSRRRFEGDDSFGEIAQRTDPGTLVFYGLAKNDFYFVAYKPLKLPRSRKLALQTGRADFERVLSARNYVLDVQNSADMLRDMLAIGVRDAFRFVDENAQQTATASAQHLDVNHFQAGVASHPFGDFLHFSYDGVPAS